MLVLFTLTASAGEAVLPTVKPSGVLFAHHGYDLSEGADGANEFAVDRAYVRADATVAPRLSVRVTLDADRFKDSAQDTKYRLFLKHAYVEAKDLVPGVKLRLGMIDTPYTTFYDAHWGQRYLAESFAKRQGLLETADLGLGAWGDHGKGLVNWNLSLVNGEGYGKLETDAGKAAQGRFTLDPLAPGERFALPITGFVSVNGHPTTDSTAITWAGATGLWAPYLVAWAEVLGTGEAEVNGLGYSATLNPRWPKVGGVVLRFDQFDPDTEAANDANSFVLAGLSHDFAEKVSTALTYERAWTEGSADAPAHGVFVRMQAGW